MYGGSIIPLKKGFVYFITYLGAEGPLGHVPSSFFCSITNTYTNKKGDKPKSITY